MLCMLCMYKCWVLIWFDVECCGCCWWRLFFSCLVEAKLCLIFVCCGVAYYIPSSSICSPIAYWSSRASTSIFVVLIDPIYKSVTTMWLHHINLVCYDTVVDKNKTQYTTIIMNYNTTQQYATQCIRDNSM